jgi:hypothetical protein
MSTTTSPLRISKTEWSYDSRNRQFRRLPRNHRTLPVGTLVTVDGTNVYRVIEGPSMDQELVLVRRAGKRD